MKRDFEYGPVARGIFIALVSLTPVLPFVHPGYLAPYLLLLLFLGLGLRPLLQWTGLYTLFGYTRADLQQGMDRKFVERRQTHVDLHARVKRFRHSRYRDPRLPRNW